MPVTHGVTGSSPVRTARNLPLLIGVAGVFVFFPAESDELKNVLECAPL